MKRLIYLPVALIALSVVVAGCEWNSGPASDPTNPSAEPVAVVETATPLVEPTATSTPSATRTPRGGGSIPERQPQAGRSVVDAPQAQQQMQRLHDQALRNAESAARMQREIQAQQQMQRLHDQALRNAESAARMQREIQAQQQMQRLHDQAQRNAENAARMQRDVQPPRSPVYNPPPVHNSPRVYSPPPVYSPPRLP